MSDHPSPRYPTLVADRIITQPDAVWVADSTSMRLQCAPPVCASSVLLQRDCVSLAVRMDVYTRAIRGWELSRHLDQALTLAALEGVSSPGVSPASITRTRVCTMPQLPL